MRAGSATLAFLCGLLAAACARAPDGADWPAPGGDPGHTRHSPLRMIDTANVRDLGLAWEARLGTRRGLEATPVVVGGTLFTSGVAGRVYAFDAATGELIWQFLPEIDMQVNRWVCCDMVNRGVAVSAGKVYVGALDGVLYALDAASGAVVWRADTVADRARGISVTGAPEIAGDVVVIGNAGAEYDVRGYVSAYDRDTGALRWRFFTVPHDPAAGPQESPALQHALETWDPASRWDIGGGGTAWDAIHYDPEFDAVYVGVGNGGPYHRDKRSPAGGDNLYLSSIVALEPATGRLKWYYQETPGDSWDYAATAPMILTHLAFQGDRIPVILHGQKNGFLYVLDRRDGSVLKAHPLVYQNWADGVDLATGRPRLTPAESDYALGPKIVFPASPGARNWHPPAFSPDTGLYYASVLEMGNLIFMPPGPTRYRAQALNVDAALVFTPDVLAALPALPDPLRAAVEQSPELQRVRDQPARSELRAIDPVTGETVWAQPMSGWQDRAGVLSTSGGLIFNGSIDGNFSAYDARSGELLYRVQTGSSIMAAPMTYAVDGEQFVAVMAAWGGGGYPYVPRDSAAYRHGNEGRLLVFRLGGGPVPQPGDLPPLEVAPEPPPGLLPADRETLARGQWLFMSNCTMCHSNQHRSITPDLRRMSAATHAVFRDIVMDGLLVPAGMPRWDDLFSEADVEAIHAYLVNLQIQTRQRELALAAAGKPLDEPSPAILSGF